MTSPKISCLHQPLPRRVPRIRAEAACVMGLRTAKDQAYVQSDVLARRTLESVRRRSPRMLQAPELHSEILTNAFTVLNLGGDAALLRQVAIDRPEYLITEEANQQAQGIHHSGICSVVPEGSQRHRAAICSHSCAPRAQFLVPSGAILGKIREIPQDSRHCGVDSYAINRSPHSPGGKSMSGFVRRAGLRGRRKLCR